MAEPMVDKSVDESLAAEAEQLLAQELEHAGEAAPADVAAAEAEADLSADVERLMRDAAPADAGETSGSLDQDLASLTESLLNDPASQAAVTERVEQDAEEERAEEAEQAAEVAAPAVPPGAGEADAVAAAEAAKQTEPVAASPSAAAVSGAAASSEKETNASQASAEVAKSDEAERPAAEAAMNADLDAAAADVEIPPAPEPPLPPAEAVGKAAAESIAAQEARKNGARDRSAPKATKQPVGATLEDLKPSSGWKLLTPLRMLGELVVAVCAMISKPLAGRPGVVRDSIGWLSVSTLFCGVSLWGYALVFRKPPEPPKPHEPVVLMEATHGPETTYAKRSVPGAAGGHDGGHGAAKKDDGHGAKKEAKTEGKKDAGHGAAKKTDAKKADAHGGGH